LIYDVYVCFVFTSHKSPTITELIRKRLTIPVILRRCRIASKTSTGLTVGDGYVNGWKNHHTADLIIGGVQTFLLSSGPVGWTIGLVWLTADLIVTGLTKKSITENLFDKNE
jgi:hypothetical protein